MRRTALRFLLCVGGGMFVETGVHPDRPARDRAGKVKVDSVFQHLNKLQKHRQRQQGQFVRQHPRRHRMGLRQGVEHPSRRMPPVGPGHLKDMVERRGYLFRRGSNTAIINTVTNEHRGYFYSPGTKTAIMAGGTWRPNLQSSQLAPFAPGQSHYLTSEDDGRTYVAKLVDYNLLSTTVFAERGGTSVIADTEGNVYLASGQVWIYDGKGKEIGVLELPERPASLAFGGPDKRTLFIGARSSLYSIRTKAPEF